jgi:hypothetical protein
MPSTHIVALRKMEVTNLQKEFWSFIMSTEITIMIQQLSPNAWHHCT